MSNPRSGPSRRTFLASTAAATAAMGGLPLLTACGGEGSGGQEGRVSQEELESILPTYRASDAAVDPDIASEHGSSPGYTRWIAQQELGVSVPEPRGGGAELTAMTPLWGTQPRPGNAYWTAMDEGIGVRTNWRIQDGNAYGNKLAATLASSDIPDLVCIPEWELGGQIPRAISSRFADLGPRLVCGPLDQQGTQGQHAIPAGTATAYLLSGGGGLLTDRAHAKDGEAGGHRTLVARPPGHGREGGRSGVDDDHRRGQLPAGSSSRMSGASRRFSRCITASGIPTARQRAGASLHSRGRYNRHPNLLRHRHARPAVEPRAV